ncbi:hypothetical protein ABVT39_004113 [Epinephelus coioides]
MENGRSRQHGNCQDLHRMTLQLHKLDSKTSFLRSSSDSLRTSFLSDPVTEQGADPTLTQLFEAVLSAEDGKNAACGYLLLGDLLFSEKQLQRHIEEPTDLQTFVLFFLDHDLPSLMTGAKPGDQKNWWKFIVAAVGLAALIIIIITVAVIRCKRTKGNKTQMDENMADPEADVSYASISYTKNTGRKAKVSCMTAYTGDVTDFNIKVHIDL